MNSMSFEESRAKPVVGMPWNWTGQSPAAGKEIAYRQEMTRRDEEISAWT